MLLIAELRAVRRRLTGQRRDGRRRQRMRQAGGARSVQQIIHVHSAVIVYRFEVVEQFGKQWINVLLAERLHKLQIFIHNIAQDLKNEDDMGKIKCPFTPKTIN